MNNNQPIIAYTVFIENLGDGHARSVESQAYMLEMTMDSEWPINFLILGPPHLTDCLSNMIPGIEDGEIYAGASFTPGNGKYKKIKKNHGQWVLAHDTDKFQPIISSGLGVLFNLRNYPAFKKVLPKILEKNMELTTTNFIIAFDTSTISDVASVTEDVQKLKSILAAHKLDHVKLLASTWLGDKYVKEYMKIDGLSGVLLRDTPTDAIVEFAGSIVLKYK